MDLKPIEQNLQAASVLLKAMSNRHRLLVLCQLANGEHCVSELEQIVGLSQSALSQHLARLRRDGLVKTRRQAQTIYYSLASSDVTAIIKTLRCVFDENCTPPDMMGGDPPPSPYPIGNHS